MAKFLIAARSESLSSALSEALKQYEVHSCHTGVASLASLESLQSDVFIAELSLPAILGSSGLHANSVKLLAKQ